MVFRCWAFPARDARRTAWSVPVRCGGAVTEHRLPQWRMSSTVERSMTMKTYVVAVDRIYCLSTEVEVKARGFEEAKQIALERAKCDWRRAKLLSAGAHIVKG